MLSFNSLPRVASFWPPPFGRLFAALAALARGLLLRGIGCGVDAEASLRMLLGPSGRHVLHAASLVRGLRTGGSDQLHRRRRAREEIVDVGLVPFRGSAIRIRFDRLAVDSE